MASFFYTHAKHLIFTQALDLDTDDIRVELVMTNTDADTLEDATSYSDFSTVDIMDGAAYVNKALASLTFTKDTVNNRSELSAAAVTWTGLGAGTRQVQGMIVYKAASGGAGATAGNKIPIAFIDTGGFPFTANGGNVTMTPNAEGLLQQT